MPLWLLGAGGLSFAPLFRVEGFGDFGIVGLSIISALLRQLKLLQRNLEKLALNEAN
jgi:hypothetical protein